MKKLLHNYLKSISSTTMRGDAREESYYDSLKVLLTDFPLDKSRKTKVTILPKQTEAGNPDFRVWDGDHFIVGYIEAKLPGTNLDQIETTEQLQRYLNTFPNLILTDFYEFRLYRDGQEIERATIGRCFTAQKLRTTPQLENIEDFEKIANQFFGFKLPKTFTAESLAVELAKRTRFLRDQVVAEELKESEQGKGDIFGFYKAFQKYLIPSLTPEQFADLYSQTITYGLFAARTRTEGEFSRRLAYESIPHSIGVLRDVFHFISLGKPSPHMEVIVDDIAAILNAADINSILDQYYRLGKGEDPIVHFYETFLNQYDPTTREKRGVYYTPEPVVKYIVKSVHHLLKTRFNFPDGLADPSVTVLDPAAGTLTFPAEAIKLAVKEYVDKYGEGGKREFIRNQVLKNFYALELMMAPYAIGHMKMSFLLESLGYRLQGDDSFQLYLTNTLEMEDIAQIDIPGISSLSEESRMAGKVKKEPVLVILGNPPYSVSSSNTNIWTEKLLKDDIDGTQSYYKVDNEPLRERNPKMLQDDYVKFLRFAQWKIHKAGKGIVAMITNHAYLDNPTFRGMRQSLMKTFDEIYILDLHGNSLKKETAPNGDKDENVFDIRQGVAIILLVKNIIPATNNIYSFDLFGLRDEKYELLSNNDLSDFDCTKIMPSSPFYFFIERDVNNILSYLDWKSIPDIFPIYSVGIVTARDKLTIAYTNKEILNNVLTFVQNDPEIVREGFNLGKDSRDWKVYLAQEDLRLTGMSQDYIRPILYRPFDIRYTYYTGKSRGFLSMPRHDVMKHFLENENISIILPKRVEYKGGWKNAFISEQLTEHVAVSLKNSDYVFPLYLYSSRNQLDWIKPSKLANLDKNLLESLVNIYEVEVEPSMVFSYVYGVLYSHAYREKYEQFLIYDFPRIPFTGSCKVFQSMAALGKRLIDLHLLKSNELDNPIFKYQGLDDNHIIEKPIYKQSENVSISTSPTTLKVLSQKFGNIRSVVIRSCTNT